MLDEIEPATACGLAQEVGAARQQLRHRMVEAAHQGARDEKTIGDHGASIAVIASEAKQSISPHEERMDCFAALAMTENQFYAGTTSSLTTTNFTRSIRPKLVVSATSAASRPVPIRMRPARGWLWRASKVNHWPDK